MSLAALVQKNNGAIVASSTKGSCGHDPIRDTYPNTEEVSLSRLLDALPTTGTSYNILLPVLADKIYQSLAYSGLNTDRKLRASDIQAFDKLIELNPATSSPKLSIIIITPPKADGRDAEREIVSQISDEVTKKSINSTQNAVCLNFNSIINAKKNFTASQLFRIASTLELLFPSLHFILFDLLQEWVEELILINNQFCEKNQNIDFWNHKKATIFISFIESNNKRFYFTDVLYGKTKNDFYTINQIVSHVHFNSINLQKNNDSTISDGILPNLHNHPAFINNCVMLPIDLILTHDGSTLFEYNASFLIQNEFISNPISSSSDLTEIITNNQGFKITNTHFRIGAKLHVADFYFAKRIFQNSFYASRFAFLLAQKISLLLPPLEFYPGKDGVTLIGYGMYSELLVSLTKKFLIKILENSDKKELSNRINNDLIEDEEHLSIVKYRDSKDKLYNNFIIIVPIASTFSTGFKIESALKKLKNDPGTHSFSIYLNVLLAYDNQQKLLQESFGWEKHDDQDRTVFVLNPNDNKQSHQHYFLSVPTTWYAPTGPNKCPMCYDPKQEKALLSTDKTAVTPSLVFGLPQVRHLSTQDKERNSAIFIDKNHITYGHHTRNSTHFLYSINIEEFLSTNLEQVEKWLTTLYEKKLASPADEILIISECHHTNITFVDLVNEKIFLSSATILHFDSKNDSIDNFTLLYRDQLNKSKIFFVDDSLKSGNTFNRIYNFVFNALNSDSDKKGHETRCIDGCITLLNKMQPKDEARIKSKLIRHGDYAPMIYSFAHLHLFSSVDSMMSPPLEYDKKRYGNLADRVVLDRFADHFRNQQEKVSPEKRKKKEALIKTVQANSSEDIEDTENKENTPKIEMFWATHYIYDLFSKINENPQPQNYNFQDVFENYNNFYQRLDDKAQGITTKDALLKVLTRPPFTQYKQIREKIFSWILTELEAHLLLLKKQINITEDDIRILKFYIRRISILNSSRILQAEMLEKVLGLLARGIVPAKHNERVPTEPNNKEASPKQQIIPWGSANRLASLFHTQGGTKDNAKDFCYFYGAQTAELLEQDTIRSLNLEDYLQKKIKIYDTLNLYQKKLIRLLFFENSSFIDILWPLIRMMKWREIFQEDIKQETINENSDLIKTKIEAELSIMHSLRLNNMASFLKGAPLENVRYIKYLWIRILLNNVLYDKFFPENAHECIMEKMITIFTSGENSNIKIGSFFNVYTSNKKNNDPLTIYNDSNNSGGLKESFFWKKNKLQVIDELTNNDKKQKSVYVFSKNNGIWSDALEVEEQEINPNKLSFLPKQCDLLILVYIYQSEYKQLRKKNQSEKIKQAIIGFYSDPSNEPTVSEPHIQTHDWLESLRYILLLRKPLSKFIANYHEHSMFSELKKAKDQKLTETLMGHGHDTITRFIDNMTGNEFQKIPETIMTFKRLAQAPINEKDREEQLRKAFKEAFCARDVRKLSDIKSRYQRLANEICRSEFIEVSLTIDEMVVTNKLFEGNSSDDEQFIYNYMILDLIMLELLINTKKNRWLFSEDDSGDKRNHINLYATIDISEDNKKKLKIKIENTGPGFTDDIKESLNAREPIKGRGRIAGTALIQYIFDFYLKKEQGNAPTLKVDNIENPFRNHPAKLPYITFTLDELQLQ